VWQCADSTWPGQFAQCTTSQPITPADAGSSRRDPNEHDRSQHEQLLQEIREANLAYLVLAQHMIRATRPRRCTASGVEEVATIIDQLSPAQLMKIAGSKPADPALPLRRRHGVEPADEPQQVEVDRCRRRVAGLHANIVMAGQLADVTA